MTRHVCILGAFPSVHQKDDVNIISVTHCFSQTKQLLSVYYFTCPFAIVQCTWSCDIESLPIIRASSENHVTKINKIKSYRYVYTHYCVYISFH